VSKAQDGERQAAIAWIKTAMEDHHLTQEDVLPLFEQANAASALAPVPAPAPAPADGGKCYRSADGQTWDGQGEMPSWLQRAVNAGQSPDHFLVSAEHAGD
jgi:DNA-binding protein H-NS